ncbi:MAG TPA: hypothetical protein VKP30_11825 [Polyangiaceae bacterium]|nr:hypothetical protein [Polyangiaceae bacterium]
MSLIGWRTVTEAVFGAPEGWDPPGVFFDAYLLKPRTFARRVSQDLPTFFAWRVVPEHNLMVRQPTHVRFLSPIFVPPATHGHLPLGTLTNSTRIQHYEFYG